jgi:hypothetical protein
MSPAAAPDFGLFVELIHNLLTMQVDDRLREHPA